MWPHYKDLKKPGTTKEGIKGQVLCAPLCAPLGPILDFLTGEVAADMPLIWPIHPRARKMLQEFGLWDKALACTSLFLLHPIGYHEMLRLNMQAAIMLTDSGGLQEECCVLGTPCLTLRWNTERPVTLKEERHKGTGALCLSYLHFSGHTNCSIKGQVLSKKCSIKGQVLSALLTGVSKVFGKIPDYPQQYSMLALDCL